MSTLSACDYHIEQHYPAFRDQLIASIRQERRNHLFLDPKWAWTSGFVWWENKLRDVARVIASERFNGHYGRALADLSRRVAAIELVLYHSFRFGSSKKFASACETPQSSDWPGWSCRGAVAPHAKAHQTRR
ncbi:hypothetical protein I6F11_07360 [Ensifer sp. NBAIM29]|nr:hypothetical protein [Ensifer sp. NBAIM29]